MFTWAEGNASMKSADADFPVHGNYHPPRGERDSRDSLPGRTLGASIAAMQLALGPIDE
jgi:hypothetical protein